MYIYLITERIMYYWFKCEFFIFIYSLNENNSGRSFSDSKLSSRTREECIVWGSVEKSGLKMKIMQIACE